MMREQKKHIETIMIIIFLFILAFVAVVFSYSYYKSTQTGMLNLGEISFSMLPKGEQEYHQINIEFSLEGKSNALKNKSTDAINEIIIDTLSNEPYEKISGEENSDYIKQKVNESLQKLFKEGELNSIYITKFNDIVKYDINKEDSDTNKNTQERDGVMKGLFPNIK